jgi:hypothetical protein
MVKTITGVNPRETIGDYMKKTLFRGILAMGLAAGAFLSNTVAEETKAVKDWTILVFVNADNNLDQFGVNDMNEATRVGSSKDVNIVFQVDRAYGKPCNRYFIEKGNAKVVEEMGEVDMGDVNEMVNFFKYGQKNYPAKHYAMVLWNHGSGWNKNNVMKGISYDDQSGNHITTAQLTTGIGEIASLAGKKLDILAFDACLMQMIEVAHAVKDSVDVMVASEETEPGEGWWYVGAMSPIVNNPKMAAEDYATAIVDAYDASYDNGDQGNSPTTQSWVRPGMTPQVIEALDEFSVAAAGVESDKIAKILYKVQKFYYRSNIDLKHFMMLVKENVGNAEVKAAADKVIAAVDQFVGHSAFNGSAKQNAHGTAIYFPSKGYSFSKEYLKLDFAKDSLWDEYLAEYYNASKTNASDL